MHAKSLTQVTCFDRASILGEKDFGSMLNNVLSRVAAKVIYKLLDHIILVHRSFKRQLDHQQKK